VAGLAVVGVVSIGAGVKMASGSSASSARSSTPTTLMAPSSTVPPSPPPTSVVPGTRIPVPGQPTRWVVFADGRFHLRGAVPDTAAGQGFEAAVAAILGPTRVVAEYSIDPAVTGDTGSDTAGDTPIFVPNAASFTPGSNQLDDAAQSELRLVWGLLGRGPNASVEIHSDPRSPNLMLDASRVDAVRRWFLDAGLAPGTITVTDAPPYGPPVVPADADAIAITVHGTGV
jgi:outer membrane protein OmpA-like peptidoglycan-associated protein